MQAKILTRLISQLRKTGKSELEARKIAVSALQKSGNLKPNSEKPTEKGVVRGNMTPAQRAMDRAKKENPEDYYYNPQTNKILAR